MNLSETAYVEWDGDASASASAGHFRLRWFTPACEVPLCGHATLAAAAALFEGEGNACERLAFDTLSGELRVVRQGDLLRMDLPLIEGSTDVPEGMGPGSPLVKAVVGDLPVTEVLYAAPLQYLLIVLETGPATREGFLQLAPSPAALRAAYSDKRLTGVICTVQGDEGGPDLLSRFFAPWAGIDEDPVTGSAHSVLGPYWAARLGRPRLAARQCSARCGELALAVDAAAGRVEVAGRAALVLKGKLLLPAGE
eukprot:scaffold5.g833.t1